MISPETNEIAISVRLIGMAARLGNSAIPEEISREAKTAADELNLCQPGHLQFRALHLAHLLIRYVESGATPRALEVSTDNLRAAIEMERLRPQEIGRAA